MTDEFSFEGEPVTYIPSLGGMRLCFDQDGKPGHYFYSDEQVIEKAADLQGGIAGLIGVLQGAIRLEYGTASPIRLHVGQKIREMLWDSGKCETEEKS